LELELEKITANYLNKEAENSQLKKDLNLNLSQISALKSQLVQKKG
jgi:hypothetical protein